MNPYDAKQLSLDGKLVRELSVNGKKVFPRLPEGYTELEYIESAANQYIKTGVLPNPNYTVYVEFMVATRKAVWDTIFGTRNGSKARFTARYANTVSGALGVQRSKAATAAQESYTDNAAKKSAATDTFHSVRLAKNKYYYDGTLRKTFAAATSLAAFPYELYLFALNDAGSVADKGYLRGRLYTIQDENNNYVRYYIPCLDPDGVAGMYDYITDTFYGSSSATAFVAGPVKEVS